MLCNKTTRAGDVQQITVRSRAGGGVTRINMVNFTLTLTRCPPHVDYTVTIVPFNQVAGRKARVLSRPFISRWLHGVLNSLFKPVAVTSCTEQLVYVCGPAKFLTGNVPKGAVHPQQRCASGPAGRQTEGQPGREQ